MSELGDLSAETDSKLIASTLMALKDIVSVEASSGESQFMTGSVESSSFGTFAITVSEGSKIVMSYILSVDAGDTVHENTVDLVQSLCTYFGKQLTQISNIEKFAKSGKSLPLDLVLQAYMNAIMIVRLEKGVKSDDKAVKRDIEDIIERLISDVSMFNEVMKQTLPKKWLSQDDRWHKGFLKSNSQDELLDLLSDYILFLVADSDPLSLLLSVNPQTENRKVRSYLQRKIDNLPNNTEKFVRKYLKKEIKSGLKEFTQTINLRELHTAESIIFNEFVRRSYIKASEEIPWIFFKNPRRNKIQQEFHKLVSDIEINNIATMIRDIVVKNSPNNLKKYLGKFFDGFVEGMIGVPFQEPALTLLISFSSKFIEKSELKNKIAKNKKIDKKWRTELANMIDNVSENALEVKTIEEAENVSTAAINSILKVITSIVKDYFVEVEGSPSKLIKRFSKYFIEIGPKIKASLLLLSILQVISKCTYSVNFMTPSNKDLIGTAIMNKGYNLKMDDRVYKISKRLFGLGAHYIDTPEGKELFITYIDKLSKFEVVINKDKTLPIDTNNIDMRSFLQLVDDPSYIIESVQNATHRRIEVYLLPELEKYANDLLLDLMNIIKDIKSDKIKKGKIKEFKPKIFLINVKAIQYDQSIRDVILKYGEKFRNLFEKEYQQTYTDFSNKIERGGNPQKEVKRLEKMVEFLFNEMNTITEDAREELLKHANHAIKEFKKYQSEIRDVFEQNQSEILRYRYDADNLLFTPEETGKRMVSYINSKYGDLLTNETTLTFNIALFIFRNPPDLIFDPIYSNIINNEVPENIGEVIEESKDKYELEMNLSEKGKLQSKIMIDALEDIVRKCLSIYIHYNGIVSTGTDTIRLHLGRIKLTRFPQRKFIDELLSLPELIVDRETENWLISYGFERIETIHESIPNIITLSDTVSYLHRLEFQKELAPVFDAMANVANLIEEGGGYQVQEFFRYLQNGLFHLN